MTPKFSLPAVATVSLLGLCWLLTAAALPAQTPLGTAPAAPKPKVASMRFLNLLPLDGGTLVLLSGASTQGPPLQVAPPSNFYAPYLKFQPARAIFKVCRLGNPQNPIKTADVPLKGGGYYTLLAHLQPDGQPTVEVIDETPDPSVPPTNRLTVRQYCRRARVVITAAGRQSSNPLGEGESQTLSDLPDGIVTLAMAATLAPGGPPRTLNIDAGFQRARHATIYVVTDPYDRLRPRVTSDGPSRAEEDAAAAEFRGTAVPALNP